MKNDLYNSILGVHVVGGFTALLSGVLILWLPKGTKTHKKWGLIYYYGMAVVFFTTLMLLALRPANQHLWFLSAVAISSFYQAYTGKRRLKFSTTARPSILDNAFLFLLSISALACLGAGLWFLMEETYFLGFLFLFFSVISSQAAAEDFSIFFLKKMQPKPVIQHISRMTGAYAATVTAFVVNAVPKYLPSETPMLVYIFLWTVPGTLIGILGSRMAKNVGLRLTSIRKSNHNL